MNISPLISLVLFVAIVFTSIFAGGFSNVQEYIKLHAEVQEVKDEFNTISNRMQYLTVGDKKVADVDRFVIQDIITSSGSTISKVKLLTLTNPTKVISEASKVEDIPEGGYYEFEVLYSDLDLLLKKIDDNALLCDISIIPISNKVFIKVLTGGAFK